MHTHTRTRARTCTHKLSLTHTQGLWWGWEWVAHEHTPSHPQTHTNTRTHVNTHKRTYIHTGALMGMGRGMARGKAAPLSASMQRHLGAYTCGERGWVWVKETFVCLCWREASPLPRAHTQNKQAHANRHTHLRWQRPIGCLILIGHFLQKSPVISGSFAEGDLQFKESYAFSPSCALVQWLRKVTHQWIYI